MSEIQALRERLFIEQVARCDVTVPDNDLLHPKSCVNCRDFRAGVDALLSALNLEQVGWQNDLGEIHRGGADVRRYADNPYWKPVYTAGTSGRPQGSTDG